MKSEFMSRFAVVLLWVLVFIVILEMNVDWKTPSVLPARAYRMYRSAVTDAPKSEGARNHTGLPVIFAITPTYTRPVQKAELTRLSHTLRQVPRLMWIVVEDSPVRTPLVTRFLAGCGVPYTHLFVYTPRAYKQGKLPRGTEQRNRALSWIRYTRTEKDEGVLFFADDDNSYSLELFEEMRTTKRVSVWPVGLVGGRMYGRPLVSKGKVVGWYTGWRPDRPFGIDMAGFAVNIQVILTKPLALFKRYGAESGMQESDFLKEITSLAELEPKANNCTRVLVWHTRTEKPPLYNEPRTRKDSLVIEV